MSATPPGWAPPPPPPPPPPPSEPPLYAPPVPQQQYWPPQPVASPPGRRRGGNVIAIVSAAVVVVLIIGAAGAYFVVGSSYASTRVAGANSTVSAIERIDFTTQVFQMGGGYDITQGTFDSRGFQSTVTTFASTVKSDTDTVNADRTKVSNARSQLGDNTWLTAPEGGDVAAARGRLDRAEAALEDASTITLDLAQDGQFFEAYAQSLVDLDAATAASRSGDATAAGSKLELVKTDIGKAVPLAGAPGLSVDVSHFVTAYQQFVNDVIAAVNAATAGDKASYDAAAAKVNADLAAMGAYDPQSMDAAFQDYYAPLIDKYDGDLQKAAA